MHTPQLYMETTWLMLRGKTNMKAWCLKVFLWEGSRKTYRRGMCGRTLRKMYSRRIGVARCVFGYGGTDYRSRSHAPNVVEEPEIEVVKERLILDIGLGKFAGLGDMDERMFDTLFRDA